MKKQLAALILTAVCSLSFAEAAQKRAPKPTPVPSPSISEQALSEREDALKKQEKRLEELKAKVEESAKKETESDEIAPYRWRVGVHAGLGLANATTDPSQNSSNRYGLALGLTANKAVIAGLLYIQGELNYVQKGAENSHFGSPGAVKTDYLDIPLLAKLEFMIPSVRPYLIAGPGLALALTKTVEGVGGIGGSSLRTFDFTGTVGLGCGFLLGDALDSSQFTVEARYTASLINLTPDHGNWKSNAFLILVGLQI